MAQLIFNTQSITDYQSPTHNSLISEYQTQITGIPFFNNRLLNSVYQSMITVVK